MKMRLHPATHPYLYQSSSRQPPPPFPSLWASQTLFICISSILSPCLKRYVTLAHFHDDGNRPLTLLGQIDEMRKRFAESLSTDVVQSCHLVDPQFA